MSSDQHGVRESALGESLTAVATHESDTRESAVEPIDGYHVRLTIPGVQGRLAVDDTKRGAYRRSFTSVLLFGALRVCLPKELVWRECWCSPYFFDDQLADR